MLNRKRTNIVLLGCAVLALQILRAGAAQSDQPPEVKELTYTWREYRIYYKTAGEQKRIEDEATTPLIFLHGFGASSFTWRHNLPVLAVQQKVVAPDLLGSGKSDKPRIEYSPDIWVNLVNEFAQSQDYQKVTLIGNGLGGLIAAEFALKFPDKVDKLVLVDPLGRSYNLPRGRRLLNARLIGGPAFRLLFRKNNIARILKGGIYSDPGKVTDDVAEGYYRPFLSPGAIDAYRSIGRRIPQWKLEDRFKEIDVPTLIVWGEDDMITPVEDAVELNKQIPNSTLVTVPGTGHCPHEESPAQFNETLIRFLKRPGGVVATD
jgi:pimeloyl-ACP methyl ester carboxylesterase